MQDVDLHEHEGIARIPCIVLFMILADAVDEGYNACYQRAALHVSTLESKRYMKRMQGNDSQQPRDKNDAHADLLPRGHAELPDYWQRDKYHIKIAEDAYGAHNDPE